MFVIKNKYENYSLVHDKQSPTASGTIRTICTFNSDKKGKRNGFDEQPSGRVDHSAIFNNRIIL